MLKTIILAFRNNNSSEELLSPVRNNVIGSTDDINTKNLLKAKNIKKSAISKKTDFAKANSFKLEFVTSKTQTTFL